MALNAWSLWNFILGRLARAQGFLDPTVVFSSLQNFSKPSQVWVPVELLRSGAVLHARGLLNSQAIQHNLDWVWPLWVERQFNPRDEAFIPRAFSLTHINLTYRNWTALGLPNLDDYPLVDPSGLVTPLFDGWSVDAWVLAGKDKLIPSRSYDVRQELHFNDVLAVSTTAAQGNLSVQGRAQVILEHGIPVCRISFKARALKDAVLLICVRPYNPEGVSLIKDIRPLEHGPGWLVDKKNEVHLDVKPARYLFANYETEDLHQQSPSAAKDGIACKVGMASSGAVYELKPDEELQVKVKVPLSKVKKPAGRWPDVMANGCAVQVPDKHMQFLFQAALRTLVLHAPGDIYPGPFTYKRFWFRDAAFILQSMMTVGLLQNVYSALDRFPSRQRPTGYFVSQDGEWDSNGQAIWAMERFAAMTRGNIKQEWRESAGKGARWIERKRVPFKPELKHAGLLPAGFSAEHFGPSDFYYWDDFWSVAGLRAAAALTAEDNARMAQEFELHAEDLLKCIERSVALRVRPDEAGVPASPYRRMDAAAVGSLIASYPLQLWPARDARLLSTAEFLMDKYLLEDAFYHEISHSGFNIYLTLHLAQVLLRAGDPRFFKMVKAVARLASATGQWPEAIHPRTKGGCMGDGQHVWAAAEWVMMLRNMFVREEEKEGVLILCSGIPEAWLEQKETLFLGPVHTIFGVISVTIETNEHVRVAWEAKWHRRPSRIEVWLPGHGPRVAENGTSFIELIRETK